MTTLTISNQRQPVVLAVHNTTAGVQWTTGIDYDLVNLPGDLYEEILEELKQTPQYIEFKLKGVVLSTSQIETGMLRFSLINVSDEMAKKLLNTLIAEIIDPWLNAHGYPPTLLSVAVVPPPPVPEPSFTELVDAVDLLMSCKTGRNMMLHAVADLMSRSKIISL